jgi:F0F1-type ATP synthase assembly protein I
MGKSTGSYELVFSPLLFSLLGYVLDRLLGTVPVFTVLFAVVALVAVSVKIYFVYKQDMEEHDANGPWAKHS